jgi:hypothetical protein
MENNNILISFVRRCNMTGGVSVQDIEIVGPEMDNLSLLDLIAKGERDLAQRVIDACEECTKSAPGYRPAPHKIREAAKITVLEYEKEKKEKVNQ